MNHMQHQRGLSGGLPYARLVTWIMEYYDIDLRGESKKNMSLKEFEIHVGAVGKNMGIYKDNDGIFNHRDVAPPELEGDLHK